MKSESPQKGGSAESRSQATFKANSSRGRRRFNESPVERVKRELGSMRDLLANHGHQVRGQSVRCPSPDHEDRHPSASVFEGRDGERLHCHSCGWDGDVIDVARALGMIVELGTAEPKVRSHRSPLRPISRGEAERLASRPSFAYESELAKILARVPEPLASRDLLLSWDYLAERYDLPFVVAMANIVRRAAA